VQEKKARVKGMLDRSKNKSKSRRGSYVTLADYVKQYAHPLDNGGRKPPDDRDSEVEQRTEDQRRAVDERAARKAVAEQPAEPSILHGPAAAEQELVPQQDRQGGQQAAPAAFLAEQVLSHPGTRRMRPAPEASSDLLWEVTTAREESLSALRVELAHAQEELARVADQTCSALQLEVKSLLKREGRAASEQIALGTVAALRQEIESQKATLSELSARVSAQQRKTSRLASALPRARQRRQVWLPIALALLLVAAVGVAGVLLLRDRTSDQRAGVPDPRLLVELGTLYQSAGEGEKAARLMGEAMDAGIYDAALLGQVGQLYLSLGDYEKAIEVLDRAVKTRPGNPELRLALARSQRGAGQYEQAIAHLEHLIQSDPDNWQYHAEAGQCYLACGESARALFNFERMLDIDPNLWQAYVYKGDVYRRLGHWNKALSFYNKALEASPSDYNTWLSIAECHAGQEDMEGAVQGYQKAIAIAPEQAQAYFGLGQVYLGEGLFADALEPLQRAVELQPGWTEARLELGKTYLNLDDCVGAQTHFGQVLGVEPENPDAQQGMAACEGE
jgi:tetratricopeptide (TPR) repeat protein